MIAPLRGALGRASPGVPGSDYSIGGLRPPPLPFASLWGGYLPPIAGGFPGPKSWSDFGGFGLPRRHLLAFLWEGSPMASTSKNYVQSLPKVFKTLGPSRHPAGRKFASPGHLIKSHFHQTKVSGQ